MAHISPGLCVNKSVLDIAELALHIANQELSHCNLKDNSDEDLSSNLLVPFFVVEYKKDISTPKYKGANQLQIHSAAMSKFLSRLGMTDLPVFKLLTDGTVGIVTCAFTLLITHIMDCNLFTFNISKPKDALIFAVFLFRLSHGHVPKLVEALKVPCDGIRYCSHKLLKWTQTAQNPRPATTLDPVLEMEDIV
ncbi:uncharacterized protein PHACADRAFT_27519 [Phanerochaete carnosa HHB-10118-sp]|uniref:Uncharacterized protein n=1 Tax=Phanerochaete carnosa (strain HHB-10118-sp) TaxID=650164 RepID=K5VYS3_PHACS|nr:uncharacterized protein PHACADRAFT_27519 [Phanerochaete carnosa HHB-10118-sp]EKM56733.1 hypothetical protein PHACADRAFT_27519 [Phanerochaete carnosa HHB-10118-sp]